MTHRLLQKYLTHPLEGVIAHGVNFLTGLMPIDMASNMGGWIARTIGPHLKISNRAKDNLERAFPDKTPDEINEIIKGMWDNLGRVTFEFAHIPKINIYQQPDRFEIIGAENVTLLRDDNQPGIFFAAHMANWEICSLGATQATPSLPVHMIYREPDNPWTRSLFAKRKSEDNVLIPKGAKGAKTVLQALKNGGHLALLIDQKMNNGIPVPFFGRDAMTAPAMAQFALKFNCPIVPSRIERIKGATFRLTLFPPMKILNTGDREADTLRIMTEVNQLIESWITERPEQWLWLHRRWPND